MKLFKEGQGIRTRIGHVTEMTDVKLNMLGLLECKDEKPIYFTNLIRQTDKRLLSIFKGEEDYIFLNKVYVDLIDLYEKDIEMYGTTKE